MTLPPVVSVVGKSGSGKTVFLEKLISVLKSRGLKIGVIKHDPHGFEIDTPGKDSWRHAQAGSDVVILSSPERLALIKRLDEEMTLDAVVSTYLQEMDLVITEGYKKGPKKKIEVSRRERSQDLVSPAQDLIAIVTDQSFDLPVPHFGLDDAEAVADLLEEEVLRRD
ncbi:MAG TPA: molybdopterin-guanine dinucleotide biosynthesis protein B [Anaerolineae bacterium]|nr:molybdopterin-guanine dinucleotide biosynthesis protein B [Anaerolineae bacterium]